MCIDTVLMHPLPVPCTMYQSCMYSLECKTTILVMLMLVMKELPPSCSTVVVVVVVVAVDDVI